MANKRYHIPFLQLFSDGNEKEFILDVEHG